MPRINIYKARPTKKLHIIQTYYIGGMQVVLYKSGMIMIAYSVPTTNKPEKLNLKKGTRENEFFRKMVRSK